MWVWPAIVIVPVRAAPVLAAAVKATVPLPLPLAPAVIVIHCAAEFAVHPQPGGDVTPIGVPAPPVAPTVWLAGVIDDVHEPAA